jgi:hypothetical protein
MPKKKLNKKPAKKSVQPKPGQSLGLKNILDQDKWVSKIKPKPAKKKEKNCKKII